MLPIRKFFDGILKVLIRARVDESEEAPKWASPGKVGDADDDTNSAGTDRVTATWSPKRKVCV